VLEDLKEIGSVEAVPITTQSPHQSVALTKLLEALSELKVVLILHLKDAKVKQF
jgi:hypothetical protein